jgi:HEAT repeat protein
MMTGGKRWLVLLMALVALALAVLLIKSWKSEVVVQDRPLRYWLEAANNYEKENEAARTNAEAIVRGLGTRTIPYLLDLLETSPGWREKFGNQWNDFAWARGWSDHTFSYRTVERADRLRSDARKGFEILGTNGVSAMPKLRQLMRDKRYTAEVALVLGHIQSDEALDLLIPLLKHTNAVIRNSALDGMMGFNNRESFLRVTNEFVRLVDDPDEQMARFAVNVVAAAVPAHQAIPILTRKFNDPRVTVARGAVGAFFGAGPYAEVAMPAIATMLTNSDEKTRGITTNVLILINPARASEFGIFTNGIEQRFYDLHKRVRQEFATNPVPYLHQ